MAYIWIAVKMALSYFAITGTIYLLILTWQDYKNKMLVDNRYNFFMFGITISLLSHISRPFWYLLVVFLGVFLTNILMKRVKSFGEADINTLSWLFFGLQILNFGWFFVFFGVFFVISGVFFGLKLGLFRQKQPVPFYPVILISFVLTSIMLKLYFI